MTAALSAAEVAARELLTTIPAKLATDRRRAKKAALAYVALLKQVSDSLALAEAAYEAVKAVRLALIRQQLASGMSMEEIGGLHGLSRQRIGQLLRDGKRTR